MKRRAFPGCDSHRLRAGKQEMPSRCPAGNRVLDFLPLQIYESLVNITSKDKTMASFDDYVLVSQFPEKPVERMIAAFRGWPDAGDAATATLNYMLTALGAEKFAEIDPEEFFNFAQERPRSTRSRDGIRHLQWPANEFYLWPGSDEAPPAVFYLGTEPHLRWRTFASLVGDLARTCGVKSVVHIGALLDAVPHTRVTKFSGSSTNQQVQAAFDRGNVRTTNYQGPSGITLPVSESLAARSISYTSLWGHVSHYLHATPNFRVGLGLAQNLSEMLGLPVDLNKLTVMAESFDREVAKVIDGDDQLGKYILTLEKKYDAAVDDAEMPDPADLVRDLERFLRAERTGGGED